MHSCIHKLDDHGFIWEIYTYIIDWYCFYYFVYIYIYICICIYLIYWGELFQYQLASRLDCDPFTWVVFLFPLVMSLSFMSIMYPTCQSCVSSTWVMSLSTWVLSSPDSFFKWRRLSCAFDTRTIFISTHTRMLSTRERINQDCSLGHSTRQPYLP